MPSLFFPPSSSCKIFTNIAVFRKRCFIPETPSCRSLWFRWIFTLLGQTGSKHANACMQILLKDWRSGPQYRVLCNHHVITNITSTALLIPSTGMEVKVLFLLLDLSNIRITQSYYHQWEWEKISELTSNKLNAYWDEATHLKFQRSFALFLIY